MPKKAGMEAWKKKRRQEYLTQKEFRYYIFCEGVQTEPQYFNGFKRYIESNPIYRDMVLIEIEPCGAETMRVIGQAEQYVRKNKIDAGQIWCVYDKDSFPAEHFNGVIEKAENLNRINPNVQYHAAWSNECIEFWFLLHFSYYTSNNYRTEYIDYLNKKLSEHGIGKYAIMKKLKTNLNTTFAVEAKCYEPNRSVGVKETSRLISRIPLRTLALM